MNDYGDWFSEPLGRLTFELERDQLLRLAGDVAGALLLDAGAGDGIWSLEWSRRGARVICCDRSKGMMSAALRRFDSEESKCAYLLGDMIRLPFTDNTFDIVVMVTALCFIRDDTGVASELVRVLKPGGKLIVGELGRYSLWAAYRKIRGWLGDHLWRSARFRAPREIQRIFQANDLFHLRTGSCVYYPPFQWKWLLKLAPSLEIAAKILIPWSAAFWVFQAEKKSGEYHIMPD